MKALMRTRFAWLAGRRIASTSLVASLAACGSIALMAGQASAFTSKSLHDFNPYPDGSDTYTGLVQGPDGNYYGVATGGGYYGNGAVFKVASDGTYTVLHSFAPTDGVYPQ